MAYLQAKRDRQRLDIEIQRLSNKWKEALAQLEEAESEQTVFLKNWDAQVVQLLFESQQEQRQLQERLAKAAKLNTLVELKAPEKAVVLEIARLSVGSVIKEAEPLLTLVPMDDHLEVEIEIDAQDIGHTKIGNSVRLKLEAYPFQKYGTLSGVVQTISADAFSPPAKENASSEKRKKATAIYRSKVRLTSTKLPITPKGFQLIPGMTLTAEINVGTRKIIDYFLDPLIKIGDESLREP